MVGRINGRIFFFFVTKVCIKIEEELGPKHGPIPKFNTEKDGPEGLPWLIRRRLSSQNERSAK